MVKLAMHAFLLFYFVINKFPNSSNFLEHHVVKKILIGGQDLAVREVLKFKCY